MPSVITNHPVDTLTMMQRLFRLKSRLHVSTPETMLMLRQQLRESNIGGKSGGANNFDMFYNVGIIFAHSDGPITMGELSRQLNVPLSTATRVMDWFVNSGYAQRLPDPEDRRIVRVALTDAGQKIYGVINTVILESVEKFMQQFTPEERETFTTLLNKVLNALETED